MFKNIIVLFSDGRSGSNAIFSWLKNNVEDSIGFYTSHDFIKSYPLPETILEQSRFYKNILFRSEFTTPSINYCDVLSNGAFGICDNFFVFFNLRDFYNYISSWISMIKINRINIKSLNHKIYIWKTRAKRYFEEDKIKFILYNKWDISLKYRREIKSIFSTNPIVDINKEKYNCSDNTNEIGLPSSFKTNNRHRRFEELSKYEFEIFEKIINDNPEACEISDEIFGKIYTH